MIVMSIMCILLIILCVAIVINFPHSKLGNWIRRNIITDEDLEPPI